MKTDKKEELLNSILCDSSFEEHNRGVRIQALLANRRRQQLRRTKALATVAVLIAGAIFLFLNLPQEKGLGPTPSTVADLSPKEESGSDEQSFLISEKQLLSFFPSNSCFLVEVEGRRVLIFQEETMRREFFGD